jgi:SAM-dependent methyltransferase
VTRFPESAIAHALCVGSGIEIGGSAHNPFGLDARNVDYTADMDTVYKLAEVEMCGEALAVDIVAQGDALPLGNGSVDFVVSSHVLEHFTNPLKALREWDRVVRVGGVIFAIVPHRDRTFDAGRERTTLEHVVADFECGATEPHADSLNGHDHVWVTADVVAMMDWLRDRGLVHWEWLAVRDIDDKVGNGFLLAVRKVAERDV